jgi:hypothetical protein
MLFILGLILTGIVIIVPIYTQESSETMMIAAVRDAAAQAATYIDTGVVSDDPVYGNLTKIIEDYTNYQSIGFRFIGVKTQSQNETTVKIIVKFEHSMAGNSTRDKAIAGYIGNFLKDYLSGVRGFAMRDGHLYQNGKQVVFNITVGGTWEVVR